MKRPWVVSSLLFAALLNHGCAGQPLTWGPDDPRYATGAGHFVTVDGKQIFYIDQGAGPVVLLLHGVPTSSWEWREVIPVLAERYRVIAPDVYGFGYSDRPLDADYTWPGYGAWLGQFLNTVGVERATIVGAALGGSIAREFLTTHPEQVSALVLINTAVLGENAHLPFLLDLLRWRPTGWMAVHTAMKPMVAIQLKQMFGDTTKRDQAFIDHVWANVGTPHRRKVLQRMFRSSRMDLFPVYLDHIRTFGKPILAVWGEADRVFPVANLDALIETGANIEVHRFAGTGHYVAQEKPEELAKVLLSFLDKHRAKL